ncbi:MAG: acyl-CoA thioesterase [Phycisphaerales bacterium]|nr:acyl-CoA thioesterase [Phycisphaerales bacterium]
MDALGHVNNVAYFRYLETARVAFLMEAIAEDAGLGSATPGPQTPAHPGAAFRAPAGASPALAPDPSSGRPFGFILQAAEARFRRPLFFPDELIVTSGVEFIGPDRFALAHEVFSRTGDDPVALGRSVIVCFDYARGKSHAIGAEIRAALEARVAPFA